MNSEKIIMCFCGLLTVLFLGLTGITSELRAQEIKLKLSSEVSETIVLMPVLLDFRLMNFSERAVTGIPLLEPETDSRGIRLNVSLKGIIKKEIKYPVLNLIQKDIYPPPSLYFELKPGQTENCLIVLDMDWFFKKPIFPEPGLYILSGSHNIPGIGKLESNSISINIRAPATNSETEAVKILSETDVLSCFYYHTLLYYMNNKTETRHIAQSMRKLYELNPPTPYRNHAKTVLIGWRDNEIKFKSGDYPGARKIGLDNLGLTDLSFDEMKSKKTGNF